jgi:hypothetical protein
MWAWSNLENATLSAILTLSGSPPKYLIFCCTHSRARHWSFKPRLSALALAAAWPGGTNVRDERFVQLTD